MNMCLKSIKKLSVLNTFVRVLSLFLIGNTFIQVNLKREDLWTEVCMLKIHPFKYIEVCSFLVYIFWLASHVCDKILTF